MPHPYIYLETEGGACSPLPDLGWKSLSPDCQQVVTDPNGSGQLVRTNAEKILFVPRGKRPPAFFLMWGQAGHRWEIVGGVLLVPTLLLPVPGPTAEPLSQGQH